MNVEKQDTGTPVESMYGDLIHTLPDIIYRIDPKGRFSFISNSISRWGHDPSELIGKHFREVIHPDDLPRVRRKDVLDKLKETDTIPENAPGLIDERRTGERITKNLRIRLKPGIYSRIRKYDPHYEVFSTGLYDCGKNNRRILIGTLGVMRDISEVKSGEIALVRTEKYYRRLIKDSMEMISILAHDGTILYKSPSSLKITGYPPDELIGSSIFDFVHCEDAGMLSSLLGNGLSDDDNPPIEYLFRNRYSGWRRLESAIRRVTDTENNTMCYVLNSRDITEIINTRRQIKESAQKFRTIVEHLSEVIAIVNSDGEVDYASPVTESMFGYTPFEIAGTRFTELFHPEDRGVVENYLGEAARTDRQTIAADLRCACKDGSFKIIELAVRELFSDPIVSGLLVNMRDVTGKKNTENALRYSEEKYRTLYENALVGMLCIDYSTGRVLSANEMGCSLFGHASKEELTGQVISEKLVSRGAWEDIRSTIERTGTVRNREVLLKRINGTPFWAEFTAKLYPEDNFVDTVIIDISKNKEYEEHIFTLNHYDSLTGLPNKQLFEMLIEKEILQNHKFALMCIGIDRFKNINEMFGISMGDRLLRAIADKLKDVYFKKDIVAHFESDKFIVLLPNIGTFGKETDIDNIDKIAKKVQGIFSDTFVLDGIGIDVTTSIGMCVYPDDGGDPESLIKNCESAMYIAKGKGGKAFHYFDVRLNEKMMSRLVLERELSAAINRNEFFLCYQPKVDGSGRIEGLEALLRWHQPERGVIGPAEFIPLAEKNGMIIEIGRSALEMACMQGKRWQEAGFSPVRIAVNLSPYQFAREDLLGDIKGILQKTGLDPCWLELEITESGIMQDERDGISKLHEIHRMGIALSIDDFGTGYSSLNKLRIYPVDTLKIDKSLVDSLPGDPMSSKIAETIMTLGHTLGFKVVAEGVETSGQLGFLKSIGCDQFQGYYFYRPLPPDKIESILEGGTALTED